MQEEPRIILSNQEAIFYVELNDILYCNSHNSYTTFYFVNHDPIIISRKIKDYEDLLSNAGFFRPHQSYLINLIHVKEINRTNDFTIVLTGNKMIPTSTRKRKALLQILDKQSRFQTEPLQIQIR